MTQQNSAKNGVAAERGTAAERQVIRRMPQGQRVLHGHRVACPPLIFSDGRVYNILNTRIIAGRTEDVVAGCTLEAERECYDRDYYLFYLTVFASALESGQFAAGKTGWEQMQHLRERARKYLQPQKKARSLSLWDYPIEYELK